MTDCRVERDRGDSLIEVLCALAIMAIATASIFAGLAASAKISGMDRNQSNASAYVRDWAERIESSLVATGATFPVTPTYTPPSGTASVTSSQCATSASETSTSTPIVIAWGSCSSSSNLQQLTLKVTAPDGASSESLTIVVRRPCNGASGSAGVLTC